MSGSGLYIHIPFCKSKCFYCDFYSIPTLERKGELVDALVKELKMETSFLGEGKPAIRTVYFGGGTPSLFEKKDFELLFKTISDSYDVSTCEEITLEANPDDLTTDYIGMLRGLPFNRISIGIQSFNDDELHAINRRHTAAQASAAVENCYSQGFNNISIDLMYGLPGQTVESFADSVEKAATLPVKHISSYALSWEEGSVLYKKLQNGELKQASDEFLEACYHDLNERLKLHNFMRYELSNFSLPGYKSKHNSSYWDGTKYLGIGPGAHSYNETERRYNIASVDKYIEGLSLENLVRNTETLDVNTKYNEFIMTRLRTSGGFLLKDLEKMFGISKRYYCLKNAAKSLRSGFLVYEDQSLKLDEKGLFVADSILSDLIWA